jgi:uncharacterized protein (DUF1015 family)
MYFEKIGISVPKLLLPKPEIDCTKWSVIACDQFNHDRSYWEEVKRLVGDSPSTLNLIYPEAYLNDDQHDARIARIHSDMNRFVAEDTFRDEIEGFLLIERILPSGKARKGLVVALDLERYDSRSRSKALIRTTEGTYPKNLAARLEVRRDASLDVPHILVLIDDSEQEIIEPLFDNNYPTVANFELMMNGGRVQYQLIDQTEDIERIASKLARRIEPQYIKGKYGMEGETLLYAMGDGNHSFAAAQKAWEGIRSKLTDAPLKAAHPARYALVELVNLHDDSIDIEPIHRIISGVDVGATLNKMVELLDRAGAGARRESVSSRAEQHQRVTASAAQSVHCIPYRAAGELGVLEIQRSAERTIPETMEALLDRLSEQNPELDISFIHGEEVVDKLADKPNTVGFYMPPIPKDDVFGSILTHGAFPRKSISIGHADEKRYYFECRKIVV